MENIVIDTKPQIKTVIKFGLAFQGFLILLVLPVFVLLGLQIVKEIPLLSLLPFGGAIFFFFVGKKYLEKVFYKEYILLNRETLTLVQKTMWERKDKKVFVKDIQFFGFAGELEYTKHPMDNPIVDFTGLGTTEREIQFIIDEGTIEIETNGQVIRFGKNVPSWDAEEIIGKAESYLGTKFKSKYPKFDA